MMTDDIVRRAQYEWERAEATEAEAEHYAKVIERLEAENARLWRALMFYSELGDWLEFSSDEGRGEESFGSKFGDDMGKVARAALAHTSNADGGSGG
jgi:hypothetical protein